MDSTQINSSNTLEALDCISRQAAIDKFKPWLEVRSYGWGELNMLRAVINELENLPTVQPKQCKDCALYADRDEWK